MKTKTPPFPIPVLIWDGECEFCAFWVIFWKEKLGLAIGYRTFQDAALDFPDINKREFLVASHFIETDGSIYKGARSAYRSLYHVNKFKFLDRLYLRQAWFRKMSDKMYRLVSHNRSTFFRVTKFLYGSDPSSLKPFWAIYLVIIIYALIKVF
ncbi:MAG: putative DCC family thiol-disulfide oxidoreductase YuxK [Roseivirga sp.]|jgi:predicted DCC family thiol-disulfide oxidoreductase YuxK